MATIPAVCPTDRLNLRSDNGRVDYVLWRRRYMGGERIIGSDTFMGNEKGFNILRREMVAELERSKAKGGSCTASDQGHLNYLYAFLPLLGHF